MLSNQKFNVICTAQEFALVTGQLLNSLEGPRDTGLLHVQCKQKSLASTPHVIECRSIQTCEL